MNPAITEAYDAAFHRFLQEALLRFEYGLVQRGKAEDTIHHRVLGARQFIEFLFETERGPEPHR